MIWGLTWCSLWRKVASQRVDWGIIPQNTLRKGWKRGVFIIQTPVNHIACREEVNPKSITVYDLYPTTNQPKEWTGALITTAQRCLFRKSCSVLESSSLTCCASCSVSGKLAWVTGLIGFPGGHHTWLENAAELYTWHIMAHHWPSLRRLRFRVSLFPWSNSFDLLMMATTQKKAHLRQFDLTTLKGISRTIWASRPTVDE